MRAITAQQAVQGLRVESLTARNQKKSRGLVPHATRSLSGKQIAQVDGTENFVRHSGRRAVSRCAAASSESEPAVMLEVKGLCAVVAESGKEILRGVDLTVREGEVRISDSSSDS